MAFLKNGSIGLKWSLNKENQIKSPPVSVISALMEHESLAGLVDNLDFDVFGHHIAFNLNVI